MFIDIRITVLYISCARQKRKISRENMHMAKQLTKPAFGAPSPETLAAIDGSYQIQACDNGFFETRDRHGRRVQYGIRNAESSAIRAWKIGRFMRGKVQDERRPHPQTAGIAEGS
jgi:hypothetical protein